MNKVSRFLALLLGVSAFVPSYSSQAAKKYKSDIKKIDDISGVRRRKKSARKGKSAALVGNKKNGSKDSKVESFVTKNTTTSKSDNNGFSLPWFLTGGGSGGLAAGFAGCGLTKLYDHYKYKKLVGQLNPSGGNNEQFDQLQKDKSALEAAIGLISPQRGTSAMSYADFINIVSRSDGSVSFVTSIVFVNNDNDIFKCAVGGAGITDTLGGEYTFIINNPEDLKNMSFTAKAPGNAADMTLNYANYFGGDVTAEAKKKMLLLSLAGCMLKKAGFRFSNDLNLMDGILFSVASILSKVADWSSCNFS